MLVACRRTKPRRMGAMISPSLEELVDPELKAAVKSKCGAKNLVLAEDQEKNTDADAEQRKRIRVADAGIRSECHRYSYSMAEFLFRPHSHKNQKPCCLPRKRRGGRTCIDFATILGSACEG